MVTSFISKQVKRADQFKYFQKNIIDLVATPRLAKKYVDVSKEELEEFNADDLDSLKNYFYKIFENFEKAYNDLDYNTMKLLSTRLLYQKYYTGITLDLDSGRKKIIKDIKRSNMIVYDLFSSRIKQTASTVIEISYIKYTTDKNGRVISGNADVRVTEKFEVIFRKDFDSKEVIKCPNCGAMIVGNKCNYCRTTVKNESFKIDSIRKIINYSEAPF